MKDTIYDDGVECAVLKCDTCGDEEAIAMTLYENDDFFGWHLGAVREGGEEIWVCDKCFHGQSNTQ